MCIKFFIIFIFLSKNIVFASPQYNPKEAEVLAPGWSESIGYKIPEPGTYDLYNVDNAELNIHKFRLFNPIELKTKKRF